MSDKRTDANSTSRRNVLKSAAAGTAFALLPSAVGAESADELTKVTERGSLEPTVDDGDRTITIRARGEVEYTFGVTGALTPVDAAGATVEMGTVSGSIGRETHLFRFSGEFTKLDVDGDAEVHVDGEPFDVEGFPHNSLTVIAPPRTEIDVSASGRIETSADVPRPNLRTVRGELPERTTFEYAGELTYFEATRDVQVRKNGEPVSVEEALPSRLPGEVRISGPNERVTVRTSADARLEAGQSVRIEDGTITAAPGAGDAVARYDGNVEEIEHESGATVEFRPSSKRIVCTAPEDAAIRFGAEASEAVVYDREAHWDVSVTVDAGETEKIKYYGDPTAVSIGDLEVSIDDEAHEDAVAAAKLQSAAAVERTAAFGAIAATADGRIRHDAASLFLGTVTGQNPSESVAFQIADARDGDRGAVHVRRDLTTGNVENAGYEIQWLGDDGYPETIEIHSLKTAEASPAFETETVERGASSGDAPDEAFGKNVFEGDEEYEPVDTSGAEPELFPSIPNWIPSMPSPGDILDAFGDVLDDLATVVDIGKNALADAISAAVQNAQDTTIEDIVIDSLGIYVETKNALIALVAELDDMGAAKTIWKIRVSFISTLFSLGTSGALQELADGNYGCGGCIAIITITVGVGLGVTATATCIALGIGTLGWGGVACAVFFSSVFTYGETIFFPDAEAICSWYHTPTEVAVC